MENFEAINSHETNQNHIFGLIWLGQKRRREENRGKKSKEEEEEEEEEEERKDQKKFRYVFALESWVIEFLRFGMEISCSFGLGFVQRSHKPLNLLGL